MKTVDIDLTLDVTEEAKICLNCDKKKCFPSHCKRFRDYYKSRGGKANEGQSTEGLAADVSRATEQN